jgi:hypothetical protein
VCPSRELGVVSRRGVPDDPFIIDRSVMFDDELVDDVLRQWAERIGVPFDELARASQIRVPLCTAASYLAQIQEAKRRMDAAEAEFYGTAS